MPKTILIQDIIHLKKTKKRLSSKRFFVSLLFITTLLIGISLFHSLNNQEESLAAPDTGWLTGWNYRKSHTINSATGAGTNYQVKIIVYKSTGTDTGQDVYLGADVRDDFGDVRFTDNDGESLLDYWIETFTSGVSATFWVEVQDDLSSSNQTIYIYYDKSDATTTSNGENTFSLFDVTGIQALWHMNESSWNGTPDEVEDDTGVNDGTAKEGANITTSGKFNKGGIFDGTDDYVEVTDHASLSPSQYTLSLFAKKSSEITSERVLLTKGIHDITYRISALSDDTVKFTVQDGTHNLAGIGALTLETGEQWLYSAVIDPEGEYAYFGAATNPSKVVKVRLSDFTRVGALTFETGENSLYSSVIDPKGEYAYFGTNPGPTIVVKVRLSDFTRIGALTFEETEDEAYAAVIDPKGEYAYFGTGFSPAKVVKVRLSDFTRVGALTLETGEDELFSAVIDPKGEFAYFGTDTTPGKVIKVRLSDFTRVGALTLETGENILESAIIDHKGEYAYFVTWTSGTPGIVTKVRLSDFTRVGALTLETGESNVWSGAVIDPKGEYAYFGTCTSPGIIVKVRLSDFTRIGAITLETGENYLDGAVIDPKGEYIYFGTEVTPAGKVMKVRLSDFTTDSVTSSSTLSSNFTHIAAVQDSTNLKLYVNGTLEDFTPLTVTVPTVTDNLLIGSRRLWLSGSGRPSSWVPTTLEGSIDEVTIFNKALSTDEVSALSSNYMEKIGTYYIARKLVEPEPSHGGWGSQEKANGLPCLTGSECGSGHCLSEICSPIPGGVPMLPPMPILPPIREIIEEPVIEEPVIEEPEKPTPILKEIQARVAQVEIKVSQIEIQITEIRVQLIELLKERISEISEQISKLKT